MNCLRPKCRDHRQKHHILFLCGSGVSHMGCPCFYSCTYRTKLRRQYTLPESPCGDCLVHCCCTPCAICQEYRELKHRGYDPSIGWIANVERMNRGITMGPSAITTPPVIVQGMPR